MKRIILIVAFLSSLLANIDARAQLFNVSATRNSNSQTINASFNSVEEALNFLNGKNLNNIFGANVDSEAITAELNYRGLDATLSYDTGNNLTLNINGIVSNQVFSGSSRESSIDLLKDYFKSQGGDILNQINRRLAAVSPSDPLAGNPSSLMSQMIDEDFELAFTDSLHDDYQENSGIKIGNEIGLGTQYSHYNIAGINSDILSISPFSYRKNIANSNTKLLIKIPVLKMILTEGAKTYQATSSFGFHIPIYKDYWSIVPMASIGAVGSEDMASVSAMHGFSATNKFKFKTENGIEFYFGTLLGTYKTDKLKIKDYVSDPKIENTTLRNSFVVSIPVGILRFDISTTNTRFYGTDLYIKEMMDYGIGLVKTADANNNEVRFDLKYYSYDSQRVATIGNGTRKIEGISANVKFQF